MSDSRRNFLKQAMACCTYIAMTAGGFLIPGKSFAAWSAKQFAVNTLSVTMRDLYAGQEMTDSDKIKLKLPRIAENGAVVPITVTSTLGQVTGIDILVEKNPVPLAARFEIFPGTDAFISGRLKMAETCNVIAVARANGKLYSNRKSVKVTIGGCGG